MKIDNLLLLSATLPALVVGCKGSPSVDQRPNVLMILVDDLGKEWIEQYGAQGIKLPNIQLLADQSIIFNRAYSMPQSTPSRAAILTGQYPYNNGWVSHFDVPRWGYGAQFDINNNPCFPRLLRDNGYKTCAAGKWQLNDFRLQPNAMELVGFDNSFMWTGGEKGNEKVSDKRYWDPYIHTDGESRVYEGKFGPDLYSDYIVNFIEENSDDPMFIYYPMTLTHSPFVHTPLAMDAKTTYEKHLAMTEYTDYIVGKLVKALEDNGVLDNTYIIFTTDNGTSSGCVGNLNGTYIRGGKTLQSENGINCPFIVHVPGQKESRVTDAIVDFTDISATILELTGTERDPKYKLDGVSFVPVLNGADKSPKGYAVSMGGHPALISDDLRVQNMADFRDRVIIGDKYKAYITMERKIERIYDITNDRFEQVNLVDNEVVMSQVIEDFTPIIKGFPDQDANPKYDILPHDTLLNSKLGGKRNVIKRNFAPISTEEEYTKFINNEY